MRNVSRAGRCDGADVVWRPRVAAKGRGDWVHDEAEKCGAIGGLPSHASCDIVSPSQSGTGLPRGCRDPNATPMGQMIIGRGCSSVVERHVANVNVEGSTPFTRFFERPGAARCRVVSFCAKSLGKIGFCARTSARHLLWRCFSFSALTCLELPAWAPSFLRRRTRNVIREGASVPGDGTGEWAPGWSARPEASGVFRMFRQCDEAFDVEHAFVARRSHRGQEAL